MEEDNIAISLCIIIIASAILRIRRDRRRRRVWHDFGFADTLDMQLIIH